MNYIAVVHKDQESEYGVSFPDFPGCISAGKSIDEAKDMALEALGLHIKGMVEDKEELPSPTSLEEIISNPDYADALTYLVIPVPDQSYRAVRINITVPENVLLEIDLAAKRNGMSRSGFFVNTAKKAISK